MKSKPGSSGKKSSRSDIPEEKIIWQDEVRNFDIASVQNRHCDVVLLVESDITCTEIVNNLPRVAKLQTEWLDPVVEVENAAAREVEIPDSVKVVFQRDVVPESPENVQNEQLQVLQKLASVEVAQFLADNEKLPVELLSLLIKLKIMEEIQNDVEEERKMLVQRKIDDSDLKRIMNEPDVTLQGGGDGKKKGKKSDKGSEKSDKSSQKDSKASKGKKGGSSKTPKSKASKQSKRQKSPQNIEVTLSDKDLYIVLAGFYDKELIEQLTSIGVPLTCFMDVCRKLPPLPTSPLSNQHSLDAPDNSLSSKDVIAVPSATQVVDSPEKVHREEIKEFWGKVVDILQTPKQYDFAESMFRMKCVLNDDIEFSIPDTEKYRDEMIMVLHWKNILEHVLKIENIRWRYSIYMRNIKLQTLGEDPKFFNTRCLKYYNKLMGKFPPDCINLGLILTCLIEDVCTRLPADTTCEEEGSSRESSKRISPVPSVHSSEPTHGGVREQILLLMNRYKERHVPLDNPDIKYHPYVSNPHMDIKVETKAFMIHPQNELQMLAKTYRKLSKELFAVTTNALKLCKSARLRRQYDICENIEKIMNEYNLDSWAQALEMTREQLCDAIQIYLYAAIQCNTEAEKDVSKQSTMSLLLPRINRSLVRSDTKIQVLDFLNPDSRLIFADNSNSEEDKQNTNVDNIYEDLLIETYSYKEPLPPAVVLQQLALADQFYECSDVKYCSISDTLLYRFHHKADEFGINTTVTSQAMRTPTCLRDFCKYTVHEDGPWLDEQNRKFDEEQERRLEELRKEKERLILERYKDVQMPEDSYFYFPDSYKAEKLKQEKMEAGSGKGRKGKGKKGDKGSKDKSSDKSKKSKKGDKKKSAEKGGSKDKKGGKAKGKKQIESNLSASPILKTDEPLPKTILSPRCAEEGEPYTFVGYDLSKKRFEVESVTTSFHSLDGVSVYVEKLTWLGKSPNITIKIDCKGSLFVIHHNPEKPTLQFLFHFSLADGTVAAFAKPLRPLSINVALCKRICQSKKNKDKALPQNTAYKRKQQEIYFVSEKHDCIVRSLKVPYSTESNIILSENSLLPFLYSLQKFNIKAKVTLPSETLRDRQKRKHNLANRIQSQVSDHGSSESDKKTGQSSNTYKTVPKLIVKKDSGVSLASDENYVQHSPPEEKLDALPDKQNISSANELLQILKNVIQSHLPVFKICSSRLHKYNYVTRTKSYINIPIGNVVKRVLYRPKYRKSKRTIQVSKCFPIGCTKQPATEDIDYEFSVSLPSGLMVRNTPGIVSPYPCIKQYYIDKGPQCKNIQNEESRIFMRNGNIAVKRCDGNIDVYSSNGSIYHFEIPYVMKTSKERADYTDGNLKKLKKFRSTSAACLPLHACLRDLPRFQKLLHRILRRRYKHLVDGNESRYCNSRRAYMRSQKKYTKDPNQFYFLQTGKQPFPEYTVITPEGKKIKISNTKAYEENKYYIASEKDHMNNEVLFEREDGTTSILNGEGVLATQFPDGTRLTTWYVVDLQLIYPDQLSDAAIIKRDKSMQTAQDSSMNFAFLVNDISEGWVSVYMFYQYSHPNYATVLFRSDTNLMDVTLPNSVVVSMKDDGSYMFMDEGQIKTEINSSFLDFKVSNCYECDNKWMATLKVEPLYEKMPITPNSEFLRVRDTYGKVFLVDYWGKCTRNLAAESCATNNNGCNNHTCTNLQKLLAVRRDFSGCLYWNIDKVKKFHRLPMRDSSVTEEIHGKDPEKPEVVVFKKNVYKPVNERYLMNYDQPMLILTKYIPKNKDQQKNAAYFTQRIIYSLPDMAKIQPIAEYLESACNFTFKNSSEKFEAFLKQTTEENSLQSRTANFTVGEECADPCLCDLDKAFESVVDLRERWYRRHEESEKYKQLLLSGQWPCYFNSKYGEEFDPDEYKQRPMPKSVEDLAEAESKSSSNTSIKRKSKKKSDVSITKGKKKASKEHADGITVEKEKSTKVSETKSAITRTIKETLKITVPNNLVVIYNQEGPIKSIKHPENAVTINSELPPSSDDGRDLQKILLMTDLSEKCKREIAKEFIKQNREEISYTPPPSKNALFKDGINCEKYRNSDSDDSSPATKVPCNSEFSSSQVRDTDATLEQVVKKLTDSSLDKIKSEKKLNEKPPPSEKNQLESQESTTEKTSSCPEFSTHNDIMVNPVLCQIQQFSPSEKLEATVSQTLGVLFNAGPFLKDKDQDDLIHGILRKSGVKKYETNRLSQLFKQEILNCNWVQMTTANPEQPAEVEAFKTFLRMLREHLKKLPQEDTQTTVDLKDLDTQKLKYRVTLIVGDAINTILEYAKNESKNRKFTLENRLSLLDGIVRQIVEANLDPKEVGLFIQSLENAAAEEISKLTEDEHDFVKDKMALVESVINSLERYKNTMGTPKQDHKQSRVRVDTSKASKEQLKDKSKMPALSNISTVFKHYSSVKGRKSIPQKLYDPEEATTTRRRSSGANQSNVVTFLPARREQSVETEVFQPISGPASTINPFFEGSKSNVTAVGSTIPLPTEGSVSRDASSGSMVTISLRPDYATITDSLKGLTSTIYVPSGAAINKKTASKDDGQSVLAMVPPDTQGKNVKRYWGERMAQDCRKWNKKLERDGGFKPAKGREVKQERSREVEVLHYPSMRSGFSITMSDSDIFNIPKSGIAQTSPSMVPLCTPSISTTSESSTVDDVQIVYQQEGQPIDSRGDLRKKESFRLLHSLGTQTQEGRDLEMQTSHELLGKCCLGRKWS